MDVDRNEKIWAWSSTGSKVHAFVTEVPGSMGSHLRAMCRSTINRNAHTTFTGQDEVDYSQICLTCLNKAIDMWDRAEASMEPAQERHDIGYVAPAQVEERSTPEKVAKPRTWGQELGTVTERHDVGYVAPQIDEKVANRIPSDMNRELLRQARAVAVAHKRLFERRVVEALHAENIKTDKPETRWEYSGTVSVLDDYNRETLGRISGDVTAADWDDARSEVLRIPVLASPRTFLTDLRIAQA